MSILVRSRALASGALLLALSLTLTACAGSAAASQYEFQTKADLITYLQREGITLQEFGAVMEPAFSGDGTQYNVLGGGTLYIFEYRSATAASLDASQVNGAVLGMSGPKIYQDGPLLAVYTGNDARVQTALSTVLGRVL